VTIHDLAVLKDEPWFSKTYQLYYSKTVPLLLKNAAHVLTDSAFIRNEILNSFPLHEENVSVCRLGVDKRFFINPNVNSQNPYILAVGSLDPRKNFLRLFHAWESVCNRFPGFELHVVGGGTSIFKELDLSSLKMTQIKFIQRASDSELLDEYRSATAFVYPSLYEGFGLPVIEAMAAGLPVLTSEKSAMAEITGDLAVLVDPQSEESIAEGIVNLLKKQDLHSTLSIQGKERARDFSWDDTASSVTRILQKFGA
jgi:glycosyltransferase involved in cell wall biosynthesis